MFPSQLLKGVLEGCLLQLLSKKESYAYEISNDLKQFGFGEVSEGTIYPLILRLQKNDLVFSVSRESSFGPPRKYYSLTKKGEEELEVFKKNWINLNNAIQKLFEGEQHESK